MWHHTFAVATGTAISFSLGRQYGLVPGLSFLDIYDSKLYNPFGVEWLLFSKEKRKI
jgi:hypothetical protein